MPSSSASSVPSSPLSSSPPSSSLPSPSPLQAALSQLGKARAQLRHLLPAALTSSSSVSDPGGRSVSKVAASLATEHEQNERIAAAYSLLASFIAQDGKQADEEEDEMSRDELLSKSIALSVYNERYVSEKKRTNDELAARLSSVDLHRREDEEEEAQKRRQLLSEAQHHGLRSLSSSVPISASCSPALVTVMAIIHRHLRSRVVTDVPATLELFAAVIADLTAQVQREENRETTLKQMQLQLEQRQQAEDEQKSSSSRPQPPPLPQSAPNPRAASGRSDDELLVALSRLPVPLQSSVRTLLTDCVRYAEAAAASNPDLRYSSLSSHSFAGTLHAFRTDVQDVMSDDVLPQRSDCATVQRTAVAALNAAPTERRSDQHESDEAKQHDDEPTLQQLIDESHSDSPAAVVDFLSACAVRCWTGRRDAVGPEDSQGRGESDEEGAEGRAKGGKEAAQSEPRRRSRAAAATRHRR